MANGPPRFFNYGLGLLAVCMLQGYDHSWRRRSLSSPLTAQHISHKTSNEHEASYPWIWSTVRPDCHKFQCRPMPITCLPPSLSEQRRAEQSSTKLPPCTLGTENQAWRATPQCPSIQRWCWPLAIESAAEIHPSIGRSVDRLRSTVSRHSLCLVSSRRSGIRRCARDRLCKGVPFMPGVWSKSTRVVLWHVSPSMCKQPFPFSSYQPFPTSGSFQFSTWGQWMGRIDH